ncbi:MAG: thioredoxin family protein [Firmicutes bacterium]|nr:thioredoxin family protein [Bacillota bacterium]
MALLNDGVRSQIRDILGAMPRPVELNLYRPDEGEASDLMTGLLAELAEIVPALRVRHSDAAPTLEPGHDTGMPIEGPILTVDPADRPTGTVRFLGLTVGLEFASLIEAIRQAGQGGSRLSPQTLAELGALERPVHIQVFTTPSCPYCPQAVRLAHEMAFASDKVVADMVDASTYQELSEKYAVMGVPAQFFNGKLSQVGLAPEANVLRLVRQAGRLAG